MMNIETRKKRNEDFAKNEMEWWEYEEQREEDIRKIVEEQ